MSSEITTNRELAKKMRNWAIGLLVGGVIALLLMNEVLFSFAPQNQLLFALVQWFVKLLGFFGLPLAASLIAGSIVVGRLPEREAQ